MMSSYSLDVEMFISEVKKYPEIWDLHSEDNRDKSKKQQSWSEIARLFITDFDEMSNAGKFDVFRKLHGKWRNIRDSYVRHLRRKNTKSGYVYAKHLTFLDNLYKQNSQSGSDVDGDNDKQSDEEEPKLKRLGYKTKKKDVPNEVSEWGSDSDDSPSTIDNLKRKRSRKQEDSIEYVETSYPDASLNFPLHGEDEDRSFFESLLPAVRVFNMDQKLEFRSEVLRLIKNIRSTHERRKSIKRDTTTGDSD